MLIKEAGGAQGALACWHKDEFNRTPQLFSHLHLCKGPVVVANIQQADSLWKQPAKTKRSQLTPATPSAQDLNT